MDPICYTCPHVDGLCPADGCPPEQKKMQKEDDELHAEPNYGEAQHFAHMQL